MNRDQQTYWLELAADMGLKIGTPRYEAGKECFMQGLKYLAIQAKRGGGK